jgi:hypothetical protein
VKRALGLSACFVAGLALFAVGGVAGAADGLTTSSTTTTAPAATSTAASTTTTTTTTTAATTSAPAPTTTVAPTTSTTTTTPTTPAPTTTAPRAPELPWWIQLLLELRRRPTAAPATTDGKPTASSSSSAKSAAGSSSSSAATAPAVAAAPAEEAIVQPPPPPPAPGRLVVSARATQADLTVGSTLTVVYTVQNTGGRAAGALLTDALPAAVAPIYVDAEQGACTGDQALRCTLGAIGPGRSVDVTLVLQVTRAATFVNAADADTTEDDVTVADPPSLRFTAGSSASVRLSLPR